jgi:hypothetical protein
MNLSQSHISEPFAPMRVRPGVDPYLSLQNAETFEQWWKDYSAFCKQIHCRPGDKKAAAIAWVRLEQQGVNPELITEGTEWDIEERKTNPRGAIAAMPHARNYLLGTISHPSPYWQVALEDKSERLAMKSAEVLSKPVPVTRLKQFAIEPEPEEIPVEQVTNQGIDAAYSWNGLYFRSKSEVKIAEALDKAGVMFLPNCRARLNGAGKERITREADFLVCFNGCWGVLEVDGEAFHPAERSATEHERDRLMQKHGLRFIQRYPASQCYSRPDSVVKEFLELLKQFHS